MYFSQILDWLKLKYTLLSEEFSGGDILDGQFMDAGRHGGAVVKKMNEWIIKYI